ncbi:integral membrane protein [Gaeumannomyces tritici R3-111a-1]|uniref:Integral membrane protein n=1 Tax=Gaeumannomyces tritici (strain R3-111a-1) TaxID=644352 RepID=J3PFE3_GAET3|nr:integral membrane protein [Gaeumannomyces tritici R3-111a-1]EJT70045.1 integral membrane protein [Gaeumannomyces tritici R3-111a-1]
MTTTTTITADCRLQTDIPPVSGLVPIKAQASGRVLGDAAGHASSTAPSEERSGDPSDNNGSLVSLDFDRPSANRRPMILTVMAITQPALINFLTSFTNGIITVCLPTIARSVNLQRQLYLWPVSVFGLTSGSLLLLAGSTADLIGARAVEITGASILGIFSLASGFAQTGEQLVAFRAIQGIGAAMHLPASVSLVAAATDKGRARNFGFAALGFSQPLGFSVGLVLGGVLAEYSTWRIGFYVPGGLLAAAAVAGRWTLPKTTPAPAPDGGVGGRVWSRFRTEIDWVGVGLASSGLTVFSYVLAILSADLQMIRSATTISLLALSLALLASFPFWMGRRERAGRPALVPNSLWGNVPFTTICALVAISWGTVNSMELFSSLYFQEVQRRSSLTASLFLLPNVVVGTALSLMTGVFVHRLPARWLTGGSSLLCAASPLLMALVEPAWSYWHGQFWAQVLVPVSADVLFTVGLIVVSESFPERTQALAGAVFNTVGQLGLSLGVGVCQVVALGVAGNGSGGGGHGGGGGGAFDDEQVGALLRGYRASFWAMFGQMLLCTAVAVVGLRKVGKVGVKRE